MTPEMLNFHQVISELEIAEENMLDNHKQTTDELYATYQKAIGLLKTTDEVTYDQEGECGYGVRERGALTYRILFQRTVKIGRNWSTTLCLY